VKETLIRVEWVEVLPYELEKNVAFGRSRREGISSEETIKRLSKKCDLNGKTGSPSVNSGLKSRNLEKTSRIGFSA